MVLEAGSPKSRCWQALLSLKTLGEDPSSPLPNSVVTDNLDFVQFAAAYLKPQLHRSVFLGAPVCKFPSS